METNDTSGINRRCYVSSGIDSPYSISSDIQNAYTLSGSEIQDTHVAEPDLCGVRSRRPSMVGTDSKLAKFKLIYLGGSEENFSNNCLWCNN